MVKKYIGKKIVTKLKDYKKKKEKEIGKAFEKKYLHPAWASIIKKIKYERALEKQTGKKIPKSEFIRRREEFLVPSPKKTKVPSLDEHKRKKYKPFTKEHLATYHKLENRSDILKPKKIKRKKGEINIIALPPKKKMHGGLVHKVIKGAIKRAKKQGKWPTKNPLRGLGIRKTKKTIFYDPKSGATAVKHKSLPKAWKKATSMSRAGGPALKAKKSGTILKQIFKTKIPEKIDRAGSQVKRKRSMVNIRHPGGHKIANMLFGKVVRTKRLKSAKKAIDTLLGYETKQSGKERRIMRDATSKAIVRKVKDTKTWKEEHGSKMSPKERTKRLKRIKKLVGFKDYGLKQGGRVKYKEPVEIKKVRQAVKKVKSKKTIKKKAVTAATEAVKFTKWPERLSTKEPSKKGFWVDPQGGGLYHGVTSVRRAGRKTTLKSGKLSVSKKGNEYEALYGRTKFKQRPGYKSIGRGGKDWSAEIYGTKRDSGFRFQRTWKFKEGGVVPNKKGEFIAIGCGKVMGNRRKTTKIR